MFYCVKCVYRSVTITVQRLNGTRPIIVWPSVKRKFTVENNQTVSVKLDGIAQF